MSPYRITERYLIDPVIGPAMAKLTRVGIADGKLVLTRIPGETPVDMITDEQVDSASTPTFHRAWHCGSLFPGVCRNHCVHRNPRESPESP